MEFGRGGQTWQIRPCIAKATRVASSFLAYTFDQTMSSEWRYSDGLAKIAIPGVTALIAFLSYSSQYLFRHIEPASLTTDQAWKFNILVACIWISYARTCLTDPGRVPKDWQPAGQESGEDHEESDRKTRGRFCRKCEAIKPPRSHHCKVCKRYIGSHV